MKQKLLKTMFLLCALVVGSGTMWADEVTFTPGTDTGSTSVTKGSVTATMTTMNNASYYQIYANQSGTFSISSGNITKIEFTCTASGTSKYGPGNASANVGSYSYSESTGTWTGSATSVTISSTQQVRMSLLTITYTPAAPAYTITAQSNNNEYGTVSLSGSVITGSPKSGYRYASPAYSITSGSATVSQDGNAFTVTPSSNCTVQINFEAIPTHTATFSVNGITTSDSFYEGQTITFPSDPSSIAGKTFVGWVTSTIVGTTDDEPEFVSSATMSSSDITYYAVFAAAEAGDPVETKTQTLQYDTWTYSGTTTDKSSYRLFGNSSYIQSAAFDLSKLSKVIVYGGTFGGGSYNSLTIGDGTNTWKSVTVTGASQTGENTYTDGTTLSGTKALYITATAGDGSNNGLRISKVEIYTNEPSVTYSAYCTSIEVTTVETPEISPASGAVASGTEVTITCSTDGASIYYTTDGTTPTSSSTAYNPASKPTITAATTIKAIAVKDGLEDSEVASATYTIAVPCETPTFSLDEGEYAKGTTVTISTGTAGATIYYTTNGDTPTTSSLVYSSALTINANQTIKAIAVKDGYLNSAVASASYTIIDYATLPFIWNGGTSSSLTALTGVTANGLGSDYADSNAPYRVKMDTADDYIQVKTNAMPGKVYVEVKMLGGDTTSKIKVQESANGSSFTDVEEFTISGKQNDVLNLVTTNTFNTTSRYVKIIKSVHASGGNIGVGPITITGCETVTIGSAGYTTYTTEDKVTMPDGVTAYIATAINTSTIHLEEVENVPADEPIILKADAGTYYLPIITTDTDDVSENILESSNGSVTSDASNIVYALAKKSSVVGFYKVSSTITVPEGKAYFKVATGGGGVKEFYSFEEDDATAIENVNDNLNNGTIYNIAGQRLQKLQKGINIVNGKKVLF